MKCPKCDYLGFEPVDRCRNCGYEFVLAQSPRALELPLRSGAAWPDVETPAALDDRPLRDDVSAPRATGAGPVVSAHDVDLPLFGGDQPTERMLLRPPPVLRAVPGPRRSGTDTSRRERQLRTAWLELDPGPMPGERLRHEAVSEVAVPIAVVHSTEAPLEVAGLGARLSAVLVDLGMLAAIDVAVIYFTMQICGVGLGELTVLPRFPLVSFLVLQNGGYLVAFTATGQTLGKMLAGVRVVSIGTTASLDAGQSLVRTILWFVLALPAGLGFLPALFSRDSRGPHDRLAGTRVVRAT